MKILCYYQIVLLTFLSVKCKLLFQKIGRKLDDPKYNVKEIISQAHFSFSYSSAFVLCMPASQRILICVQSF